RRIAAPLEGVLVALEHEASVLLEERDRVDARVELLVADREPLGSLARNDQRLLHEIAEYLLWQSHPLGQLGGEPIAVDLRVRFHVRLIAALEALDRDRLAVDRRHGVARLAAAELRARRAEHEERGDERRDDGQQTDLERLPKPPHHR